MRRIEMPDACTNDPAAYGDVMVEWRTENGTGDSGAVAGQDYSTRSGTLTITSSNPNPTIAIPITDDSIDEVAETFDIRITSANNTAQASTHTVTVNDDDGPPSVSVSPTTGVLENDGTVLFRARLSSSGRVATVDWRTGNATAEASEDYEQASGTMIFAKGDVEETFTVEIADDMLDEGDETFDIVLSSSDGTARPSTHAVTITGDNDGPPSVSLDVSRVDEDAGQVTFTAILSETSGRVATVPTRHRTAPPGPGRTTIGHPEP